MATAQARRNVLLTLVCAQFIITIGITFTNVLPSILANDLHSTHTGPPIAIMIYALAMTTSMIASTMCNDFIESMGFQPAFVYPTQHQRRLPPRLPRAKNHKEGGQP